MSLHTGFHTIMNMCCSRKCLYLYIFMYWMMPYHVVKTDYQWIRMNDCAIFNHHVLAHTKQISCSHRNDNHQIRCICLVPSCLKSPHKGPVTRKIFPSDDVIMVDITTRNILPKCHLNIRSMWANMSSFEICLKIREYNFPVIDLSETWFRYYNCNLYSIDNHTCTCLLNFIYLQKLEVGLVYLLGKIIVPYQIRNLSSLLNVVKNKNKHCYLMVN